MNTNKLRCNVLVTPSGVTGVNVINALRQSTQLDPKIISLDSSKHVAGLRLSDKGYIIDNVDSPRYFEQILTVCKKESIQVIIPLLFQEIALYASNLKLLKDNNINCILPAKETIDLCNNKLNFYKFLKEHSLPHPALFDEKNIEYPAFFKLQMGSSSKGSVKLEGKTDLDYYKWKHKKYLIQEFVDWDEYTVDCYVNQKGKIIATVPRKRLLIKAGQAIASLTEKNEFIEERSSYLLQKLNYKGACNIQLFYKQPDQYKLIEINPRLASGGLPVTVKAGINIPELIVLEALGKNVSEILPYRSGLNMIKYYNELFFTDDDSIPSIK